MLNIFNFKDNILFENNVPLINLHGIKFKLDHPIFLKHSGKKYDKEDLIEGESEDIDENK